MDISSDKQAITWENWDITKNGKPLEKNWIS